MSALVELVGVSKEFVGKTGEAAHLAVSDVSFTAGRGETLCLVGRTGCGKSTLVNMMLGLEQPSAGSILIDGVSPVDDFMGLKRRVAAVFQTDRLLPWRTII